MSRGTRLLAVAAALTLLVGLLLPGAGVAQREWQWVMPVPQGESLRGIAYGAGQYVAVGRQGAILTSPGGTDWAVRPAWSGDRALLAVAYGLDRFVAVGEAGSLLTSVDGSTWVARESGTGEKLHHILFARDRFVALGPSVVLVSADGLAWKQAELPYGGPLSSLVYDGRQFLALGSAGAVLTSPDGMAWTVLAKNAPEVVRVVHGAGRYVALSMKGSLYVSADAANWREQVNLGPGSPMALFHTGTHFVALGQNLATSADGETWQVSRGLGPATAAVHGKAGWVAVGADGLIVRSENGLTWAGEAPAPAPKWQDVAFGDGLFVLAEGRSIRTSKNGTVWTEQWKTKDDRLWLNHVQFGGGRFVAASREGTVLASADGVTWLEAATGLASIARLAWGNGRFVAIGTGAGAAPGIAVSADGLIWKEAEAPHAMRLVAHGNDRFLALSDRGAVLASPDGVTWKEQAVLDYSAAWSHSLVFARGQFFLAHADGAVWSSADGTEWTRSEAGFATDGLVQAGEQLIALLPDGAVATSADGRHWRTRPTGVSQPLTGVAYGENLYVAITGAGGLLIKRGPFQEYQCGLRFGDVPEQYPPCMAIELLESYRVIIGYPDGTFRPHQNVSRAEFAKLLVVAMGQEAAPGAPIAFPDATGHWASQMGYLQAAVRMGALHGFPGGLLQPDGPLTRAQAVKIVVAAAGFHASGELGYADVTDTGWYATHVSAARRMGLIGPGAGHGLWDGPVFRADEPVTRAEAAMLLANLRSAGPVIILDEN